MVPAHFGSSSLTYPLRLCCLPASPFAIVARSTLDDNRHKNDPLDEDTDKESEEDNNEDFDNDYYEDCHKEKDCIQDKQIDKGYEEDPNEDSNEEYDLQCEDNSYDQDVEEDCEDKDKEDQTEEGVQLKGKEDYSKDDDTNNEQPDQEYEGHKEGDDSEYKNLNKESDIGDDEGFSIDNKDETNILLVLIEDNPTYEETSPKGRGNGPDH
eukprot:Gb_38957 [translate_table: standard]